MGLIHPLPQKRYDHTMVRASPYFVNSDSSNEFDNIEQHGRGTPTISLESHWFLCIPSPDLNNIPVGQDVPVEILGYVGERDIFFPVVRAPNEGTSISYNWINPLGLWGTDSDVQV
ncbi:hypothetical protein H0H87_006205 [Tephrocybe sp. NHM501043]|nr:hypothetical protein H0H87_006205 [Tephrocybe sp. NHM501043]